MRIFVKPKLGAIALLLAICFSAGSIVKADDAPAPLPQVAFIAAKSIDSAVAFVKKTGLELPPEISADALEKQFPFLGPGSIDTARPIGIAVCGGADISSGQSMAFIFPVKPTGATLDSLKKMGGVPLPNHADTVTMGGVGLRRTADYLIFSPVADVVSNVNLDAFTASVKSPDALARLFIDFKTFRTAFPDRYKAMMEMMEASAKPTTGNKADQENAMMFLGPILETIKTLDRLEVGLDNGDAGVRLALTAAPLKIATAGAANRPGMPPGVVARVDTNFAPTESTQNIRNLIQKAFNTGATSDAHMTDEQKKQFEDVGNQLGGLIFDPASTSLGVEIVEKQPVFHVVQHWAKHIDAPAEWKRLIDQANKIAGGKADDLTTETYTDQALAVTRITLKSGETVHFDIAQRGNDVIISASPADAHIVGTLAAAPPEGPMHGVLSGWIDLGKAVDAASKFPESPLAGLPPDMTAKLNDLLRGQRISISTSAEGDAGTIDVTITHGLLENIPKLMEVFSPPAAKPDAK